MILCSYQVGNDRMLINDFLVKTDKIPGWLSRREGQLLYFFARSLSEKGEVVEVGSFQGKSTAFLAQAVKEAKAGKVTSIDPHLGKTHVTKTGPKFGETFSKFNKNLQELGLSKQIVAMRKTSLDAHKGWKKPIAVLNIDGLHEYKFAKQDLELWLPHLISNGVVICHDAFSPFPEVFAAVKEMIFESGEFRSIGVSESQIFAVKGRPHNILERVNRWRMIFFITLASSVWHSKKMPPKLADFLVKRILKVFYLNTLMVQLWFS